MLTSLYVEGNGWMHRMPVAWKLALLLIASLTLTAIAHPAPLALALGLTATLYLRLGPSLLSALSRVAPVLVTIGLLSLVNLLVIGPGEALVTLLRLPAIVFLAAAITSTTTMSAFIETVEWLLRPLERLGLLKAADLALALGLVLRFVPEVAGRYRALAEAHAARGLKVRWHRMIGPLVIATLKDADSIAEAIDARGIRRQ